MTEVSAVIPGCLEVARSMVQSTTVNDIAICFGSEIDLLLIFDLVNTLAAAAAANRDS
jgi:hypothetical protein